MKFDPNNPVIQLCATGMQLEAQGKIDEAVQSFQKAWSLAANDFERFTAAHYVARNQKDPVDNLKWNMDALMYAQAINNNGSTGHYPSLYLNIAKSYETLGDIPAAHQHYQNAARHADTLPANPYGDMIKSGINEGLKRTGIKTWQHPTLDLLIDLWCRRKDLRPLAQVLPAYISNLGTGHDINKLISALSLLSATRCLPADEQQKIDELINSLSK
ncbi:MAG: tetratricopeptide repeat protein [Flavipsychrobacter sp.]